MLQKDTDVVEFNVCSEKVGEYTVMYATKFAVFCWLCVGFFLFYSVIIVAEIPSSELLNFAYIFNSIFKEDAELGLYVLMFVALLVFAFVFSIYKKFFYSKSNFLKIEKIMFTNKGIRITQRKNKMVFDDFFEFDSLDDFFYFKKAAKISCYRLSLWTKDKSRIELNFYCKDEKHLDTVLSDLECCGKIKKVK